MAFNPLILLGPVMEFFKSKQEEKANREIAAAKIKELTIEQGTQLELSRAQWEAIAVQQTSESWKDEYVTLIVTLPLVLIMLGGVYGAFTQDMRLLEGIISGITALEVLGLDMGTLMMAVVLAAIGLRYCKVR